MNCHDCEHLETVSVDLSAFIEDYKDAHYPTYYCNKLICAFGETFIKTVSICADRPKRHAYWTMRGCEFFKDKATPNP